MRRLVLFVLSSFLVGAVTGTTVANQPAQKAVDVEAPRPIAQPADWVPFVADVAHSNPEGRISTGKYFRGADGSTRTDMRLDYGNRVLNETHIENLVIQKFFHHVAGHSWLTGPLEYPPQALRPMPWSSKTRGLEVYPHKLGLFRGQDGSLVASQGLDAYQFTNTTGTKLMVPALNFFAVVQTQLGGVRRVYSNIELVTPDPSLFDAPPGVELLELTMQELRQPK